MGDNVTFDGSADVAGGAFIINTGDGNDVLTGGNGNDVFRPGAGNDIVHGGGGDDVINMANNLNAADQLDGGTGYNTLLLDGPYGSQLTLNSNTIANIQEIDFAAGHDYNLIFYGLDVANGASLTFKAGSLGASDNLTLDGSAFGSRDVHADLQRRRRSRHAPRRRRQRHLPRRHRERHHQWRRRRRSHQGRDRRRHLRLCRALRTPPPPPTT